VPATLHDPAAVHNDDQIRVADRGQPVRDHHAGTALHRQIKCLLNSHFRF
jgi:hypothetical protein